MDSERPERTAPTAEAEASTPGPVTGGRPLGREASGRLLGNRPLLSTTVPLDEATASTINEIREVLARGDWLDLAQAILLPSVDPAIR